MRYLQNTIFCVIILSAFAISASAQTVPDKLDAKATQIQQSKGLEHGTLGFCVMDIETGKVISQLNNNKSVSPASTMKIITTSTALMVLGEDFKFETLLQHTGNVENGVLKGDLIIKGGGDPSLGSEYFEDKPDIIAEWVKALKEKGITKIEGAVIADATVFDNEIIPETWIWGDMGNYYGAGAAGLNYHDNTYHITFKSGAAGEKVRITSITPEVPNISFVNEVTAAGKRDNAYIFGGPYTYLRYIRGTIPPWKTEFDVKGSIPDPALFTAQLLNSKIERAGIEIDGRPTTLRLLSIEGSKEETERTTLHTHQSPALSDIVYWTNYKSSNLFAEALTKTIGLKLKGEGSRSMGTQAIKEFWQGKGVDMHGFHNVDGSGLSRDNAITPLQHVNILRIVAKSGVYEAIKKSLGVAGESGSLAGMCRGTAAQGKVMAKSGYINRARGYAGYVSGKSGKLYAFSVIGNNYDYSASAMKADMARLMDIMALLK